MRKGNQQNLKDGTIQAPGISPKINFGIVTYSLDKVVISGRKMILE